MKGLGTLLINTMLTIFTFVLLIVLLVNGEFLLFVAVVGVVGILNVAGMVLSIRNEQRSGPSAARLNAEWVNEARRTPSIREGWTDPSDRFE